MKPTSETSIARMLDANLNRLAEALRVAEDVCRFHWNLVGFAAALKNLRHSVFSALTTAGIERRVLVRERDIDGDVGRRTESPPTSTFSPEDLALRNLQRAKEALRVIQECCRNIVPAVEPEIQELRYRLYGEEKGLCWLADRETRTSALIDAKLYFLAMPELTERPLTEVTQSAIRGGVHVVQLRAKKLADSLFLNLARQLREVTARERCLFVINDRPHIARLVHADGVHLGQDDLPIQEARAIVGDELFVGRSTHSLAQAQEAERQGADYIGVGPVFTTATKENHEPVLGPEAAGAIMKQVQVPAFAIGGIDAERIASVVTAGYSRVAIASAISKADNPEATAQFFVTQLNVNQSTSTDAEL